jgi:hypothetical protein
LGLLLIFTSSSILVRSSINGSKKELSMLVPQKHTTQMELKSQSGKGIIQSANFLFGARDHRLSRTWAVNASKRKSMITIARNKKLMSAANKMRIDAVTWRVRKGKQVDTK